MAIVLIVAGGIAWWLAHGAVGCRRGGGSGGWALAVQPE